MSRCSRCSPRPSPGGFLPVRVKIANNLKNDSSHPAWISKANPTTATTLGDPLLLLLHRPGGKNHHPRHHRSALPARRLLRQLPTSPPASADRWARADNTIRSDHRARTSRPSCSAKPCSRLTPPLLDSARSGKFSGSSGGSSEFAGKFDPKQLPDDWLAFSGYDSVIMTDTDWSNIPPGARNAILSWVSLGGQLVDLFHQHPPPPQLSACQRMPASAASSSRTVGVRPETRRDQRS